MSTEDVNLSRTTPDLQALARYLERELPRGIAGPLSARLLPGGRSNPTYELSDGRSEWILRRPPYGTVWESAHDMRRESRVMMALHGSSVAVPTVVAACGDDSVLGAPFYVMERLSGRTLRTREDTGLLSESQRAEVSHSLVDTLVALHSIDPREVDLADFGRPDGYLVRQLKRWGRQWEVVSTVELPLANEVHRQLGRTMPVAGLPGIVHGDYKLDNVMVDVDDPTRIVGVLDWEMATLGDTLADIGWLASLWDEVDGQHNPITAGATALPGFPTVNDMVAAYAYRREIGIGDLTWYIAFSHFKLAVILQQIQQRHLRGETVGAGFDDIADMVPTLLEFAHARSRTF